MRIRPDSRGTPGTTDAAGPSRPGQPGHADGPSPALQPAEMRNGLPARTAPERSSRDDAPREAPRNRLVHQLQQLRHRGHDRAAAAEARSRLEHRLQEYRLERDGPPARATPGDPEHPPQRAAPADGPAASPQSARPRTAQLRAPTISPSAGAPPPADPPGTFDAQAQPRLQQRMLLYAESWRNLLLLKASGELTLSASGQQQFARLEAACAELQVLLPTLQDPPHPAPGTVEHEAQHQSQADPLRIHDLARLLALQQECRDSLCALIVMHPGELVPMIHNANLLSILAADLKHELRLAARALPETAAEVRDYLDQVRLSMQDGIHDAMREAQLQRDVLGLLGHSIEDTAQRRADKHRHGAAGWVGRRADGTAGHLAALAGVQVTRPEDYGVGLQTQLAARFGRLFDISVEGERKVRVQPRQGVEGYFTTPQLLEIVEAMNSYIGRKRDKRAVQAAIDLSPDLHWVRIDGEPRLELTPDALRRLGRGTTDAPAAQERMQVAIVAGVEGLKLSDLKAALAQAIHTHQEGLQERAGSILNPDRALTRAKAVLLIQLAEDLAAAPTAAMMQAHLDQAIAEHDRLWLDHQPLARDGGTTGALLADLREALRRHGSPP